MMMTYRRLMSFAIATLLLLPLPPLVAAEPDEAGFTVVPFEFDPGKTHLVAASWLRGIGCPTAGTVFVDDPATPAFDPKPEPFADPGCPTGDAQDKDNQGLLLAKTGPTPNVAAAGADLKGVKGTVLTELGYDLRKPGTLGGPASPSGSHCGAGAPRFNIVISGATYFIGCNSPPAVVAATSDGWIRLRWGGATPLQAFSQTTGALTDITGQAVDSISIVFDEGQDASGGPDQFGLAVLDNVDVNGTLVGRGPTGGK
jgi:hypothetical protein